MQANARCCFLPAGAELRICRMDLLISSIILRLVIGTVTTIFMRQRSSATSKTGMKGAAGERSRRRRKKIFRPLHGHSSPTDRCMSNSFGGWHIASDGPKKEYRHRCSSASERADCARLREYRIISLQKKTALRPARSRVEVSSA